MKPTTQLTMIGKLASLLADDVSWSACAASTFPASSTRTGPGLQEITRSRSARGPSPSCNQAGPVSHYPGLAGICGTVIAGPGSAPGASCNESTASPVSITHWRRTSPRCQHHRGAKISCVLKTVVHRKGRKRLASSVCSVESAWKERAVGSPAKDTRSARRRRWRHRRCVST